MAAVLVARAGNDINFCFVSRTTLSSGKKRKRKENCTTHEHIEIGVQGSGKWAVDSSLF